MLAAYAVSQSSDDPLAGLEVGRAARPGAAAPGWSLVQVRAAGLNHHDVWSLRGVGLPADRLPMILGCDGAGVDEDGNEVIVHAVVPSQGWTRRRDAGPAADPAVRAVRRHARRVRRGAHAEPGAQAAGAVWSEAACLSTAWLTAYRMLFANAGLHPGATVLVQGAGGGVATALVALGAAAGYRMWVTCAGRGQVARGRWSSAPTGRSSPASGCPSGSTR